MKFDEIVHEFGLRMNRPKFIRAIPQEWDDRKRSAGLWETDIWHDGNFTARRVQTSVVEHEMFHIPTLEDFLQGIQSVALSEERTDEEDHALHRTLGVLGVDCFNAIVNMED